LYKLKEITNKINKYILIIILSSIGIMSCHEIIFLKSIIKNVICIFGGLPSVKIVSTFYYDILIKLLYLIIFLSCSALFIINKFFKKLSVKMINKTIYQEGFETRLNEYLINNDKKCFVILGDWGVGKTYNLNTFMLKFSKYSYQNIYGISCFGLENRDQVINSIKTECEKSDVTIRQQILQFIKYIPIFGEMLYGFFKKEFNLSELDDNTIFIFEDFERVSINELYFNNTNMGNKEIPNGDIVNYLILEKYNVVTGLINELIEKYNFKVIVLCNPHGFNSNFYYEIFNNKLECISFRISSKGKSITDLFYNSIQQKLSLSSDKKIEIEKFYKKNEESISELWEGLHTENYRFLVKCFSAFADLIDILNIEDMKIYMESIFYTILIANIMEEENTINHFCQYDTYLQNSDVLLIKYYKYREIFSYLRCIPAEVVWCGIYIGTTWAVGEFYTNARVKMELGKVNFLKSEFLIFLINSTMDDKQFKVQVKKELCYFEETLYALKYGLDHSNTKLIENIIWIIENLKMTYNDKEDIRGLISSFKILQNSNDEKIIETIYERIYKDFNLEVNRIKYDNSLSGVYKNFYQWIENNKYRIIQERIR